MEMEQKKYLRAIKRKLRCNAAKKKEIIKQLHADIDAALEKGEPLAHILDEIGAPDAVAAEFNADMTEKEKKRGRYERYAKCIGAVVIVLCLAAAALWWLLPKADKVEENNRFAEQAVIEKAKQVIACLDADDYDSLRTFLREDAAEVLTQEVLAEAKEYIAEDFGAFTAWGNAYVSEVTQYGQHVAVVEIGASYEKTSVTYTLIFDEEMQMTGLYMR